MSGLPIAPPSKMVRITSRESGGPEIQEAYKNVAIRVEEPESADAFRVVGRGERQLAVIVETIRHEDSTANGSVRYLTEPRRTT